jgi:phage FluMu protein Com
MKNYRRKSSGKLKRVDNQNNFSEDTLIGCPRCKAVGSIVIKDDGRVYQTKLCNWCDGCGGVTRKVYRSWVRLQRIIATYILQGLDFHS